MVLIHQYKATKRMGGSRRNVNAERQIGPPPKQDHDLRLVVSEEYIGFEDDWKKRCGKQEAIIAQLHPVNEAI